MFPTSGSDDIHPSHGSGKFIMLCMGAKFISSSAEVRPSIKLWQKVSVDAFGKLPLVAGSAVLVEGIGAVLDFMERTVCASCLM